MPFQAFPLLILCFTGVETAVTELRCECNGLVEQRICRPVIRILRCQIDLDLFNIRYICNLVFLQIRRGPGHLCISTLSVSVDTDVDKSTLANKIIEKLSAKIFSGKDYLRLEKNPSAAMETFKATLQASVDGDNIIYIITEKEHIQLLPEDAFKIVLTAELDVIKARFKERMRGNLPMPVEKMLEAKHGMYDALDCNIKLDGNYNIKDVLKALAIQ